MAARAELDCFAAACRTSPTLGADNPPGPRHAAVGIRTEYDVVNSEPPSWLLNSAMAWSLPRVLEQTRSPSTSDLIWRNVKSGVVWPSGGSSRGIQMLSYGICMSRDAGLGADLENGLSRHRHTPNYQQLNNCVSSSDPPTTSARAVSDR